jgi:hypothetical protein
VNIHETLLQAPERGALSLSFYTVNQPPSSAPLSCPHDIRRNSEGMEFRTHKSRASQTLRIIYVRQIHHCQTAGPTNSDTASAPISRRVQTSSRMHCNGWKEPRRQSLAYSTLATKLIFGYRDITGWKASEEECGMIREWCCEGSLPASYRIIQGCQERRIISLILRLTPAQQFQIQYPSLLIAKDGRRLPRECRFHHGRLTETYWIYRNQSATHLNNHTRTQIGDLSHLITSILRYDHDNLSGEQGFSK